MLATPRSYTYDVSATDLTTVRLEGTYQFCSLCPGNRELKVRILFPVSKQKRKFCQEAIVNVPSSNDGLRIGVPVESSFETFSCADQLFPSIKAVWIFELFKRSISKMMMIENGASGEMTNHLSVELL